MTARKPIQAVYACFWLVIRFGNDIHRGFLRRRVGLAGLHRTASTADDLIRRHGRKCCWQVEPRNGAFGGSRLGRALVVSSAPQRRRARLLTSVMSWPARADAGATRRRRPACADRLHHELSLEDGAPVGWLSAPCAVPACLRVVDRRETSITRRPKGQVGLWERVGADADTVAEAQWSRVPTQEPSVAQNGEDLPREAVRTSTKPVPWMSPRR